MVCSKPAKKELSNASSGGNSVFYLLHFIRISLTILWLHPWSSSVVYVLSRFGLTLCPVCMGDPQDPLCLPCEHIYCVACIKQWLGPGQMYCPLCMQAVNDDFPMVPSDDIRLVTTCGLGQQECVLVCLFLIKGTVLVWFFPYTQKPLMYPVLLLVS